MQKLHLKYSVYTLDLVGFGDSAKNAAYYSIDQHADLLGKFMQQLGIPKAAFIGHGMGGLVITRFALKNPTRVARIHISSVPLFDPGDLDKRVPAGTLQLLTPRNDRSRLAPTPEQIGYSDPTIANESHNAHNANTIASGSSRGAKEDGSRDSSVPFHELETLGRPDQIDRKRLRQEFEKRRKANQKNHLKETFKNQSLLSLLEKCFKRNEPEFDKLKVDVEKADDRVLSQSAEGFEAGEMLDDLRRITAPTLVIHGADDPVLPAPDESILNYLTLEKEDVFVPILLPNVRHFPMLEHEAFPQLTTDFLDAADLSKLEIRERWRRRNR